MNNRKHHILFVNSHIETTQELQLLLQEEPWQCQFAPDATSAFDILTTQPVDLLICDNELPDENAINFLERVRNEHPKVIRLLLTAFISQKTVVQALSSGIAQQLLPKPWIDQEFREILRSALRQLEKQRAHSTEFQILINSIPLLPSLPDSYSNVRSCVQGDEIDIEKMAEYIGQDVAITSILLRWANSALFGQRFQVDTIKKAIIVLGTDIVENLILSESVNKTIAGKIPEIKGFDFNDFKKHSMATATISRLLIKTVDPANTTRQDRAFVAGLLHDLGKLVAATFYPKKFEKAIMLARKNALSLAEAERVVYSSDHAELGGFLAEWWALPPFIVNCIAGHEAPQSTPWEEDILLASNTANLLSYQFKYGSSGDTIDRDIPPQNKQRFFMTEEAVEILRMETEKVIRALLR